MKKVSSKILWIMIGCCIFASVLIGGFSLYQGSKFIRAEASDKLVYMAMSYANEFSQSLVETEGYVDALSSSVLASFDMNSFRTDPSYIDQYEQEMDGIMSKFALNSNDAFGMYFTFNPDYSNGEFVEVWYEDFKSNGILERITSETGAQYPEIFKNGWQYPCTSSFDREEEGMSFLYETLDAGTPLWVKPYQEIGLANTTLSGVTVISYVIPIIIDDTTIGVVGMDYNFEEIQKTIKEMSIYDGGYAVLLDENYEVLVRPNSLEDTKSLFAIDHQIKLNRDKTSGVIEYNHSGAEQIVGYSKLANGWTLALIQPRSEIFKPAWELSLVISLLAFISIVISVFIANQFTRRVSQRINSVTDQLKYMEIGDFNKEIPSELLNSDDDLGYFVKSVHTMQTIIKELMREIEGKGSETSESFLISDALEKTQDATSKAAMAIEQISNERVEKDENLRDTLNKLEELNFKLQKTVTEEVQKNRQKDAEILYQSRYAKMGEMIGNIAHQWRQPLNSLSIILSEMKDAAIHDDLTPEQFDAAIHKSNQIIQSMSITINEFRDFLNPSKNKTVFSINGATVFASNLMEESLRSNDICLEIELVDDAMVFGYENEFSQVISNILNNAKDALIEVEGQKRNIRIRIRSEKQFAIVEIFNNGRHIPEGTMEKLFTAYHTTKDYDRGTGIGLYMSRIIITDHMNGTIQLDNVEDGVRCCIKIPLYVEKMFFDKTERTE